MASFPEVSYLEEPFQGEDTSFQEGPFQAEEEEEAVLSNYQEASDETNAAAFQEASFQAVPSQAVPFQEGPYLVEQSFQVGPSLVELSFPEGVLFDHEAAAAAAVGPTWSTRGYTF
jgi:hypothetical protein